MGKNIEVRFLVHSDLYHLKIEDLSCWGISKGKPAVIEITMPGSTKQISKYFPQETTVYDSNSLYNDCYDDCDELTELPDGIYRIKIKASPSSFNYEVSYAKLDQLRRKLDESYIKSLKKDCGDCDRDMLLTYEFKVKEIEALVRQGDINSAQALYTSLNRRVDKNNNCKDC
jgi:hypothetical protein